MMLRRIISSMVAIYALAFALAALAAVRWPSIMLAVGMVAEADGNVSSQIGTVDWRELGITYGAPYMLAAICFYASAVMVAGRRHGAVTWFTMGIAAGFPCVFLVHFEAGWWNDPSASEGAIAGIGVAALLLWLAVYDLRRQKPRPDKTTEPVPKQKVQQPVQAIVQQPAIPSAVIQPKKRPARPRHMSAAVARQRASYAAEGRKMMAKRAQKKTRWRL